MVDRQNILTSISIIIGIAILATLLMIQFALPPDVTVQIGDNSKGSFNKEYTEYILLSIPAEGTKPVTFLVRVVNDGGKVEDFTIGMHVSPKTGWINPGTIPVETPDYLPCPFGSATECFIKTISRSDTVKLGFSVEIDPAEYEKVRSDEPKIIFYYQYKGTQITEIPIKFLIP